MVNVVDLCLDKNSDCKYKEIHVVSCVSQAEVKVKAYLCCKPKKGFKYLDFSSIDDVCCKPCLKFLKGVLRCTVFSIKWIWDITAYSQ